MIRNVAIHISNEQPLLADIYAIPTAGDAGLVCTNVRMLDGKRPIFVDHIDSVFFFPYLVIRFLEIPPAQLARHIAEGGAQPGSAGVGAAPGAPADATAVAPGPADFLPVPVPEGEPEIAPDEPDAELEIDEDFLRRVRDI